MAENKKIEIGGSPIIAEEEEPWIGEIRKLKERYDSFEKMNHGNWDTFSTVRWKMLLLKDYEERHEKDLKRIEELEQEIRELRNESRAVEAKESPLNKKDFYELELTNAFLVMKIDDLLKDSGEKEKRIKALQEENERLTKEVNRLKKISTSGMMRMID
jgi:chromosome segregation ATPase